MTDQNRGSRRQKIYDLMKTTRDVYIPTLSNTITQLASEATTRAMNYESGSDQEIPPSTDILGANILLYPHFTRTSNDGKEYYTQVHGWVYSTEGSTRKKRIIMSLARQLIKSTNQTAMDSTAGQLDEQLSSLQDSDGKSFFSSNSNYDSGPSSPIKRAGTSSSSTSSSSFNSSSINNDTEETLKERIAAFLNRSLGNLELTIAVGGESRDDLETKQILTDPNGNFNIDVPTKFRPSYIQVAVYLDERIFVFQEAIYPGDSEFVIISDIDDTIKRTGVLNDKRTVFRTTFADSLTTWEVPGAADCYRYFQEKRGFSFFYVSNSPYQLYSSLTEFMKYFEFPVGSIYLKKYSGNILNSMWEPSHTRKKAPLERIMGHFGNKKFFLIGDTSEQDLEAYVDIAKSHPDKILSIYLRVVNGSMSNETFKALNEILKKRDDIQQQPSKTTVDEDLIDLESDPESDSHIVELAKLSKIKSDKVLGNLIDLEEGSESENEFFAENKETKSPPKRPSPPPLPVRRSTSPALSSPEKLLAPLVPPKPKALISKPVPPIPRKPTNLRSAVVSSPKDESSSDTLSGASSANSSVAPPSLPRRPIPPLPPKPRTTTLNSSSTFNSNNIPFSDEANDEWISRILTSLLTLKKVGDIKLKLFVDYSEVQQDIEDKVIELKK